MHEFETKQQAQDCYILEGLTLAKTAARVGLPERTVEEWSRAEGWVDLRKEYRAAQSEIRRKTMLYRLALLKEGMTTLHPQAAFAWATVESTAQKGIANGLDSRLRVNDGEKSGNDEQREIGTLEDAVGVLQEVVERKLNAMLTDPRAVSLKNVKEMKDAMLMIEQLKAKYGIGQEKAKVPTMAEIKAIREQFL